LDIANKEVVDFIWGLILVLYYFLSLAF